MVVTLARLFVSILFLLSFTPALWAQVATTLSGQLSGAVYTTDRQGTVQSSFNGVKNVYAAGGQGPASGCAGSGLPDGTYYFQVTDPSGRRLLSTDSLAARRVVVINGVIQDVPVGGHALKNGPCGSKLIQLRPFADVPGSGTEYKLWFTPATRYTPGQGHFGFLSNASKTDNFKVFVDAPQLEQVIFRGTVFYDIDENGLYDPQVPGERPIPGWKVCIESGGIIHQNFSDVDGTFQFIRDRDSAEHVLTSIAPSPGYVGTAGGRWLATSSTPVAVSADAQEQCIEFGKLYLVPTPELARSKGYWRNQGRDTLLASDPQWRTVVNGLCLRTNFSNPNGEDGTIFTVSETASFDTAFGQLSDYLNDPANGVLAYILSVQYCAASINKSCGPLQQRTTYIDRFYNDVLITYESMAAGTLGLLDDPRSANTGPHGDRDWRDIMTGCMQEWEGMNSEGDNIFTTSSRQRRVSSPY